MADKRKRSGQPPKALEAEVHQFAVPGEMLPLLQRVRGNKNKRSASALVKTGPIRVQVIALDEGGEWLNAAAEGPFTVQCLLGRARLSMQGREHRLTTGDLLVVDAGVQHDIRADEASVLLVTVV